MRSCFSLLEPNQQDLLGFVFWWFFFNLDLGCIHFGAAQTELEVSVVTLVALS